MHDVYLHIEDRPYYLQVRKQVEGDRSLPVVGGWENLRDHEAPSRYASFDSQGMVAPIFGFETEDDALDHLIENDDTLAAEGYRWARVVCGMESEGFDFIDQCVTAIRPLGGGFNIPEYRQATGRKSDE